MGSGSSTYPTYPSDPFMQPAFMQQQQPVYTAFNHQSHGQITRVQPSSSHSLPAPSGRTNASETDDWVKACLKFKLRDLAEATNGFSSSNVIGEGGFGKVFRGTLLDGTEIAVKALDPLSLQGDREYYAEIALLTKLRHPNLVCIMGMCSDEGQKLGVFEYMERGSLRSLLDEKCLSWKQRVSIAVGTARGLAYLHEISQPSVIHCDFKSPNVLIDQHLQAHVADFGLARHIGGSRPLLTGSGHGPSAEVGVTTVTSIRGTFGYLSPEYMEHGQASAKADVFAFGVVLLELMTGCEAVDTSKGQGLAGQLAVWAKPWLRDPSRMAKELIDLPARAEVDMVQVSVFCEVAEACLRTQPRERPNMLDVVRTLSKAQGGMDRTTPISSVLNGPGLPAPRSSSTPSIHASHRPQSTSAAIPLPSPERLSRSSYRPPGEGRSSGGGVTRSSAADHVQPSLPNQVPDRSLPVVSMFGI